MNLDKDKTVAFINQILFWAALVAKVTPNTKDDDVVAVLQRVMANKELVDLVFEILNKFHTEKTADLATVRLALAEMKLSGKLVP